MHTHKTFLTLDSIPHQKSQLTAFYLLCNTVTVTLRNTACFIVINCIVTFAVLMTGRTEKLGS